MGKRVLVADDSATIQRAFAMVFGNREDVSLVPARSLDDALTAARQGRPDLVIADANLGGRTGYELCQSIKADPGLRGVPVFILASNHSPYDDGKGRDAGVDGHISKPFESQALIDKVLEILARPTSIAASTPISRPELAATPQMARPAATPGAPPASSPAFSASAARPSPFGTAPITARRDADRRPSVDDDDDDYGEFKIERPTASGQGPATARPASSGSPAPMAAAARPHQPSMAGMGPAPTSFASAGATPAAGLRPSLIPGTRPGTTPGRLPYSPLAATPPPVASAARPAPAPPAAPAPISAHGQPNPAGRTIMGLPAVAIPGVSARPSSTPVGQPAPSPGMPGMRAPSTGTGPIPIQPVSPRDVPSSELRPAPPPSPPSPGSMPTSLPPAPASGPAFPPSISARQTTIEQKLDQKMAAISARGPEYEAIAKLSREVIEQVVWEVVPELAEAIIREHVERLAQSRK
jgi:CheY-like chemotaxis protein